MPGIAAIVLLRSNGKRSSGSHFFFLRSRACLHRSDDRTAGNRQAATGHGACARPEASIDPPARPTPPASIATMTSGTPPQSWRARRESSGWRGRRGPETPSPRPSNAAAPRDTSPRDSTNRGRDGSPSLVAINISRKSSSTSAARIEAEMIDRDAQLTHCRPLHDRAHRRSSHITLREAWPGARVWLPASLAR
jgi:hypothetical protein